MSAETTADPLAQEAADPLAQEAADPLAQEAPPPAAGLARQVGAQVMEAVAAARALYGIFIRTLYWTVRGKRERGVVARYCFEIGNRSVFFITVTLGFIGMILVFQSALQALRVVPDLSLLGATFLELQVRDLAASLGALMLATRVGAGIAAEIGSMVVTEQVDALRMCGIDPVAYLIVPRFMACMIMTGVLILWGGAVGFVTGGATAYFLFGVAPRTFFDSSLLGTGDVVIGLTKCVAYGAAIPIVSGYCGLSTHGGSEGVGWATTRAVVNSSLAVIILNATISSVGFVLFPP